MLPADMNVSAVNPALQLRPEALQGVDPATGLGGVLSAIVVHFQVAIAAQINVLVPPISSVQMVEPGRICSRITPRMASLVRRVMT